MSKHVEIRTPNGRYTDDQLAELTTANDAYQAEYYRHGRNIETGVGWVCKCGWKPKADVVSDWRSVTAHVNIARRKAGAAYNAATSAALRPAPPAKPDHDYEPGELTHPMHTDPRCAVCGEPKGAH